ncbi:MAG: lytic transglycosylase domain-containing protein [Pseudomonadota bacterium]
MAWVSAMMWQESRGNANAISPAGARGVMQVMPGTQDDLVRWGWDKYQPDHMDLHLPNVGIYFGTAYLEYLSQQSSDREWITRAYNAGPGGQRSNGSWPAETVDYLARIIERYNAIRGG